MSFSIYDYPASREQEAAEDRHEREAELEVSEFRLSIIEHLDRQHAEAVSLSLMCGCGGWGCGSIGCATAIQHVEDVWAALEIVRNVEGVPEWKR